MTTTSADFWADARVIHAYSRAQAIADGVLVDVTDTGRQAGFSVPVALTRAVWHEVVAWDDVHGGIQDEAGRLWDVLWMAFVAAKRAPRTESRVDYVIYRVPNTSEGATGRVEAERVTITLVISPGDDYEPVATIMLPNED